MGFIDYPRITRGDTGRFGLDWKLPREYRDWVKRITPEFEEGMRKSVIATQRMFGLQGYSSYPELKWVKERGLTSIVIGTDDACVRLKDEMSTWGYFFNNISLPQEALALIEMLSIYLTRLQTLQEQK